MADTQEDCLPEFGQIGVLTALRCSDWTLSNEQLGRFLGRQ